MKNDNLVEGHKPVKPASANKYSIRDVAKDILPDAMWESDHFGYCSIQCVDDCQCPAVFHFDGNLRVFCVNKYCAGKERQFNIPASMLGKIADKWNQDKASLNVV